MLIQYVDDSDADAHNFLQLAREKNLFDVEISNSIDAVRAGGIEQGDLAVLVDVMRPEAISIEDDVSRLRRRTTAPIAFVAGGSTHELRDRAIRAGAIDVLDKARLTADLVHDIFGTRLAVYNAIAANMELDIPRTEYLPNFQLQQLGPLLQFLETGLGALLDGLSDRETPLSFIGDMLHTVRTVQTFAKSDLGVVTKVGVHQVMHDIHHQCQQLADAKRIKLSFNTEWAWIGQLGPNELARLGLLHFVESLLVMSDPNSVVKVCTSKRYNGAFVTVLLSKPVSVSRQTFLSDEGEADRADLAAVTSLRLASLLLNISPEQISVRMVGPIQEIKLAL